MTSQLMSEQQQMIERKLSVILFLKCYFMVVDDIVLFYLFIFLLFSVR